MSNDVFWMYASMPGVLALIVFLGFRLSKMQKQKRNEKRVRRGIMTMMLAMIFNLGYTAFFGYDHMMSASRLEAILDAADVVLVIVGVLWFYQGCNLSLFKNRQTK
jgi:glucose uptake protein GlcU